jgi:hypothetical protein
METILAVAGLVVLIVLLVGAFCLVAYMCFGTGPSLMGMLHYCLFGREAMEAIVQAIGWCLYAIGTALTQSNE